MRWSAPGKAILIGEHAAVYGRPALVVAVGLRTEVIAEAAPDGLGKVTLDLPQVEREAMGDRDSFSWSELATLGSEVADRWQRFDRNELSIADVLGGIFLPHAILGLVARWLGELPSASLRLHATSEVPIGAGMGSSASVAAGLVAATLDALGRVVPAAEIEAIVLECERLQHGHPSGIDAAAILRGGALSIQRAGDELEVEVLDLDEQDFFGFRLFDSGRPPEGTGEVVASVRARRNQDVAAFDKSLERAESAAALMLDGLRADEAEGSEKIRQAIRSYQRWLTEIGVVPRPIVTLVDTLEEHGLVAKISGAGSLAGPGAGLVLAYDERYADRRGEATRDRSAILAEAWSEIAAPLAAPGLRSEHSLPVKI